MFLLLWLQTIPSQTALSGANPISRRIAGLSGCVGVCAHGGQRARSGNRLAAHCFSLLPGPPGPKEAKQASAGPSSLSQSISLFKQPPCQGLVRAVLLTARAQSRAWVLTRREGRRQKPCRTGVPPAFPHAPQAQLSSHPLRIPKGMEAQEPPKSESGRAAALLHRDEILVLLHAVDYRA